MQPSGADTSNVTTKEYSVERLTKERLIDVEKLHEAVYERKAPKNYFNIKYNSAYTGIEYLGYVAYNNDGLAVAYYGVIPCFLQCGDDKILAAQSADTMTHPKFRFKGMFVELSNITFDLCRHSGIRVVFGFPNQNSYHGAVHKLGWKMTDTMECFLIPINTGLVSKLVRKSMNKMGISEGYRQSITRKYKGIKKIVENSVSKEGFCGVLRNEEYRQAKDYLSREILNIGGALVWSKFTNEWIIGDMDISAEDFESVMKKMKAIGASLGLTQIQFHSSPGTRLHSLFSANYSPIPSFPVLFQQFDPAVNISNIKFSFGDIDIF